VPRCFQESDIQAGRVEGDAGCCEEGSCQNGESSPNQSDSMCVTSSVEIQTAQNRLTAAESLISGQTAASAGFSSGFFRAALLEMQLILERLHDLTGLFQFPPFLVTQVGHFLRTVQYMPSFSVPCSCVCSRLTSPSVSSWHKQGNTSICQSRGRIQNHIPYNV